LIAEPEGTFTSVQTSRTWSAISAFVLLVIAAVTVTGLLTPGMAEAAKKGKKKSSVVKVMTRNLYLGADLSDAIEAKDQTGFINANGQILVDVRANKFPVRAKGLAGEIRSKAPDLVGLQEVARWATGPFEQGVIDDPSLSTAKNVEFDFLKILMRELNRGAKRYRVVKVTTEFDFEAPAAGVGNGRLTMRDVIIARTGKSVKTRKAKGGNYSTLYTPRVANTKDVPVARGWNSVEAKVGKSPWFTFANTHLEAFGDNKNEVVDCMTAPAPAYTSNPVSIRCQQAREFFNKVVKRSKGPVIAVGDFNSDDDSVIDVNCPSSENALGSASPFNGGVCGDTFAYNALIKLGMRNVSTSKPMSCCLKSDMLAAGNGSRKDFDHHIDHILTRKKDKVKKLSSQVTGLKPERGFWNSDHAGVFSKLRITR